MPFNMYGKANASLAITHGVNILMIKVKRPFFENIPMLKGRSTRLHVQRFFKNIPPCLKV
jgi:hypothetical protein